jgi:hypothetical protein
MRDLKYVRLAHEMGLGCGDPAHIRIVGDEEAAGENWHFVGPFKKMTLASRGQHLIYWGPLKKPLMWTLKTVLAPWSYLASVLYHDVYWYPAHQERVAAILRSDWGRLFQNWEELQLPPARLDRAGWEDVGQAPMKLHKSTLKMIGRSMVTLGQCMKEAPEFEARRRRKARGRDGAEQGRSAR